MEKTKKNILLIGMMGCGKTTLGKILAKKLSYDFIDMDSYIEEISNDTISNLFKACLAILRSILPFPRTIA